MLTLTQGLFSALLLGDVARETPRMNECVTVPQHVGVDEYVAQRTVLAAQPRCMVLYGFATIQSVKDVLDHRSVDVEFRNVLTYELLARIAEQLELVPIDPLHDSVRPNPMHADARILEE